jgi:hypothetical protein
MPADNLDARLSFDCGSDIEEQDDSFNLQEQPDSNRSALSKFLPSPTKGGEESMERRACSTTAETDDTSDDNSSGGSGDQLPDVEEYKASMGHRGKGGSLLFGKKQRPDPPIEVRRGDGGFREEHHLDGLLRELYLEEEDDDEDMDEDEKEDTYPRSYDLNKFKMKALVFNQWNWNCRPIFYFIVFWIPLVLLVLGATSILWGTRSSSKPLGRRFPHVVKFLIENQISLQSDLERTDSPQYQAALWIADHDAFQAVLPPHSSSSNTAQEMTSTHSYLTLVERYVFAVLYYALDGPTSWSERMNFLSPTHVCTWYHEFEAAVDADNAFETEQFVTMGIRGCQMVGDELVPIALHLRTYDFHRVVLWLAPIFLNFQFLLRSLQSCLFSLLLLLLSRCCSQQWSQWGNSK